MATSQAIASVSFKTILFATDFSPASELALPYLLALARLHQSKVIVAHAVPIEPWAGMTPVALAGDIDPEYEAARRAMQKYQDEQSFGEVPHECILKKGNLREVVRDLVSEDAADLVVLGTHGRQGLRKLFAGSFAEQVIRNTTCPILTIGPAAGTEAPHAWQPKRILFATDFSSGSTHALPLALALAEQNHTEASPAELVLMHAIPLVPWEQQSEMAEMYQQRLRRLVPEDGPHACKIDFTVRFDLAAAAILDTAKDRHADLIVMGARHTALPGADSHTPWTTDSEVISHAHCPVLTVRG
jgi:nucleotide-binding universal stress UspA family protein